MPAAYTRAYTAFGIKVVVAPDIPNNTASLEPFRCVIPEGCILNAPRPYAVSVRHVIGHLLPDLVMGCLHQAVPDRVAAEGASCLWNPPLRGGGAVSGQGRPNRPVLPDFEVITFNSGGTGARREQDGLDATAFPSGVRTMPVEATEASRAHRHLAQGTAPRQRRRRAAPEAGWARSWRSAGATTWNSPATPSSTALPTRRRAATAAAWAQAAG